MCINVVFNVKGPLATLYARAFVPFLAGRNFMSRKLALALVIVLFVAAFPISKSSAQSVPTVKQSAAQQTAATCQNADLMTGIGKDLTDLGTQFKAVDTKDVVATSQLFLTLAGTRQKYENMTVPPECLDLQIEVINAFDNASDILALSLAIQTDTANASAYGSAVSAQLTRFQKTLQNVSILAGVATPDPNGTPVGRTSQITSTTCTDSAFLGTLGSDFTGLSGTLGSTDMKSMGAIAQTLIKVISLRQKYEDLTVPSGCEVTQLTTIIAFANTSDLLGLTLAVTADPKNVDSYTKALTAQSSRVQQWYQLVLKAAGGSSAATPAATAAQ
jgi:hypothetical protein